MTDALSIRSAVAGDAPAVSALAARTFPLACPPALPADQIADFISAHLTEERFARHIADPGHRVLLAERVGAPGPVGYALVLHGIHPEGPVQWRSTDSAYLSKLYVDPQLHGGGVAGALLDAVRSDAVEAGAPGIWLNVNTENARARRFYARSGFVFAGTREFVVGETVFVDDVLALADGA